MAKILRQNVGGVDFTVAGCALTGVCPTAAADYVKQITLSDGDVIEDGMMMVVTFANGNTAGNAPNTKTIYSSDQVNYFEDEQLTVPFTLAPSGCYEIEYTGTVNAYTYTDYPVFQVGSVSGPVCDYRGHIASSDLWDAGDLVQCIFKEGKFLLLGGSGSADAGTGNPVGTIISTYKKIQPRNYLYCDGSTFDETIYPALYLYLGSNVLPDYRECAMVGAEKNTTDVFDSTETDPSTGLPGTQNHDVYAQGEFKDDQLQQHNHPDTLIYSNISASGWNSGYVKGTESSETGRGGNVASNKRVGTVTRGKRKAVYYYIKAVDGVDISDEDSFLNTVKNYVDGKNSYSTDEVPTGGVWIDGKPIYRKVLELTSPTSLVSGQFYEESVSIDFTSIKDIISTKGFIAAGNNTNIMPLPYIVSTNDWGAIYFRPSPQNAMVIHLGTNSTTHTGQPMKIILEYTKTTD
jgi:hypothetical protein